MAGGLASAIYNPSDLSSVSFLRGVSQQQNATLRLAACCVSLRLPGKRVFTNTPPTATLLLRSEDASIMTVLQNEIIN